MKSLRWTPSLNLHLSTGHQGFLGMANVEGQPTVYFFGAKPNASGSIYWVTETTFNNDIPAYQPVDRPITVGERIVAIFSALVGQQDDDGSPLWVDRRTLWALARLDADDEDLHKRKQFGHYVGFLESCELVESEFGPTSGIRERSQWRCANHNSAAIRSHCSASSEPAAWTLSLRACEHGSRAS